jgi:hypothetical protein
VIRPVIALDIDGTLGDYHKHFTRFAEEWTGRRMPLPQDINPGVPLHKHLGLSKRTYRECKLAYRRGGLKRSMPAYADIADLVRYIRHSGAEVWFTTTRPYLRLDGIDPDTRHWLRRNGIMAYDGLIFSDRKFNDLIRAVGRERVILIVDDLPEKIEEAKRLGLPWALRDQPYNQHYEVDDDARLLTTNDIRVAFVRAMYKWRESHAR